MWLREQRAKREFEREFPAARAEARPGPHEVVIVADHLRPWRNAGAIARTASIFGAHSMVVVGTRFIDPGTAMGALSHVPLRFFDTFADAHAALVADGYTLYALEPPRDFHDAQHLHETVFPEKTAFIVGNETTGLSFQVDDFPCVSRLSIAQYGGVPCLNASVAAGLALYEYVRQRAGRPVAAY